MNNVISLARYRAKRRAEQCAGCAKLITARQLACFFRDARGVMRVFCSAACCELRRKGAR